MSEKRIQEVVDVLHDLNTRDTVFNGVFIDEKHIRGFAEYYQKRHAGDTELDCNTLGGELGVLKAKADGFKDSLNIDSNKVCVLTFHERGEDYIRYYCVVPLAIIQYTRSMSYYLHSCKCDHYTIDPKLVERFVNHPSLTHANSLDRWLKASNYGFDSDSAICTQISKSFNTINSLTELIRTCKKYDYDVQSTIEVTDVTDDYPELSLGY